jgi:cytochrome c oxidase cbb3-type subunit III
MRPLASCCVLAALALAACDREERRFVKKLTAPNPLAAAGAQAELQPGEAGPGMKLEAAAGGYSESSAYEVQQGKLWYRWYNCVGCHAQGGGAIGPALMDDQWIYGDKPDDIFATIMNGRPNGMPSFRGRIPEAQAWQIVAYVRSMSGLVSSDVAPSRSEGMLGAAPENRRTPQRPDEKKKKQ